MPVQRSHRYLVPLVALALFLAFGSGCKENGKDVPISVLLTGAATDASLSQLPTASETFPLAGTVKGQGSGQLLGGINVAITYKGLTVQNPTRTTSEGKFFFDGVAPELYDLSFSDPANKFDPTSLIVRLNASGTTSPATIEAQMAEKSGGTSVAIEVPVLVQVTDTAGAKLANINLELQRKDDSTGNTSKFAFSSSLGEYTFEKVTPGSYRLLIGGEGNPQFKSQIVDVEVFSDGRVKPPRVLVQLENTEIKGVDLQGFVYLESHGSPLGNIKVELFEKNQSGALASLPKQVTYTTGDGKFFLQDVPPNSDDTIYIIGAARDDPKSYQPASVAVLVKRTGEVSPPIPMITVFRNLGRRETFSLVGNLIDAYSGKPLDYANCELKGWGKIVSDKFGQFRFDNLGTGSYDLECSKFGYQTLMSRLQMDKATVATFAMLVVQETDKGSIVGRFTFEPGSKVDFTDVMVRVFRTNYVPKEYFDPDGYKQIAYVWETEIDPVKSTCISSESSKLGDPPNRTGTFRITHLQPTTGTMKYYVFVGSATVDNITQVASQSFYGPSGEIGSITYRTENVGLKRPEKLISWRLQDVTQGQATYLSNFEE